MIEAQMRDYNYFLITEEEDEYGQPTVTNLDNPVGQVTMSINIVSQAIHDSIIYKDCSYLGLTNNKDISDKYIIQYGQMKLKVAYVNPLGRYIQVFMKHYNG